QFAPRAADRHSRPRPVAAARTQRVQTDRARGVGAAERAGRGRAGDGHRVPRARRSHAHAGRRDGGEALAGPQPRAGVIARLKVESVVHGGEALARHEGRVVFVRGAAPGDVVEAVLIGEGWFEHARALRSVLPGAAMGVAAWTLA